MAVSKSGHMGAVEFMDQFGPQRDQIGKSYKEQVAKLNLVQLYELGAYFDTWFDLNVRYGKLVKTSVQMVTCEGTVVIPRDCGGWWKTTDIWNTLPGFWVMNGEWIRVSYDKNGDVTYRPQHPDTTCNVFRGFDSQKEYNKLITIVEEAKKRGWID